MTPTTPPAAVRPNLLRWAVLVLIIQSVVALWTLTRGWDYSILDRHEYRQAQTALSIHWLNRDGFQLAYPLPLFGPPWSAPMEFPLYQALVASWVQLTGSPIETSGRGVAIFMLALTLPAVWRFTGSLGWPRPSRVLALATVLSAPVYLFYARTVMIETTALCAAVWFLAVYTDSLQRPHPARTALAATLGIIAGLAKVTTLIIFLLPAGFLALRHLLALRRHPAARPTPAVLHAAAPAVAALGIAWWWVSWSDGIKQANPLSAFLTSPAMRAWNWGTLDQRLSAEFWWKLWSDIGASVLGMPAMIAIVLLATLVAPSARWRAVVLAAASLVGTLLFSNLFFHHDYYFCATALLLMLAAAAILGAAWETESLPRPAVIAATAIFFVGQWSAYASTYGHHFRHGPINPPAMAEVIREAVPAGDVVLYYGADWGAVLPYYSQRRAIAVRTDKADSEDLHQVLEQLPPRRIRGMLVRGQSLSPELLHARLTQFGLGVVPLAEDKNERFHVAEELIPDAGARLRGRTFEGLTLNIPSAKEVMLAAPLQDLSAIDLSMFASAPTAARSEFSFHVVEHVMNRVLFIHAPSELGFTPPEYASEFVIEAGFMPDALNGGLDATDGVDLVVVERHASGLEKEWLRHPLRPDGDPASLKIQRLRVAAPGGFTGELLLRVAPGPDGRNNRDWVYLRRAEFR